MGGAGVEVEEVTVFMFCLLVFGVVDRVLDQLVCEWGVFEPVIWSNRKFGARRIHICKRGRG